MTIEIVWGTGEGRTKLNAFDAALEDAGIHNYNHIQLSSVIPKNKSINIVGTHEQKWNVGEFVATVISENVDSISGKNISSGLGWSYADEGGIFYEEYGGNPDNVEHKLSEGVKGAKQLRSDWNWEPDIHTKIVQHEIKDIGAVVVAAVYNPIEQNKNQQIEQNKNQQIYNTI